MRRLLKMIVPPKEAQWREVPPFENGLAANSGVAARSAVFIKWFGRLLKIILSPFENWLGRPPSQNGSLGRLLTMIRTPFKKASLKMSTTFYKLYCRLLKIGLPPFQKWFFDNGSTAFSKWLGHLLKMAKQLLKIICPPFENGLGRPPFQNGLAIFWRWVNHGHLLKIIWPPFQDGSTAFSKWFDRILKMNALIYKGTFANKGFENKKLTLLGVVWW